MDTARRNKLCVLEMTIERASGHKVANEYRHSTREHVVSFTSSQHHSQIGTW
uniref:Uncharacterized protein n=1 Tax=Parascaris equorum TaxID=6256 RepID=A0A914RBM9_PAREQ